MHWMKLWPFWRYESRKLLLWYKNEQLKFLSPFPYEVQIQRFNYLGVVFHFAFFLFSFFNWAIFFKFPVVKPLDKYCTSNSWFFSDILGVVHYFFKPWRGANYKHGAKFPLQFLVFRLIVLEKNIYIYIYIYMSK